MNREHLPPTVVWMIQSRAASSHVSLPPPAILFVQQLRPRVNAAAGLASSLALLLLISARHRERKGLFRKKLNGQVAGGGWLSPLYWRGGKMSLLWRPLQQIASWLDECPQVRVEHVPPAAKQEPIKGQRNPLELEVMFLSTRPLFRQHFSGRIKQSAWNLDRVLISGGRHSSEVSS